MSVKRKTFIIIILTGITLMGITSLVFYFSYYGYIDKHMENDIEDNYKIINYIISNEELNVNSILIDWAQWDDTFKFVQDSNEEYISSNLQDNTLVTLNLKMMLFLNEKGNIVYKKEYGLEKDISKNLENKLILPKNDNKKGFLIANNRVFYAMKAPITKSNKDRESKGSLIFVREIDEKLLKYINNVAKVSIEFKDSKELKDTYYNSFKSLDNEIKIQKNKDNFESYKFINDTYSNDSIMLYMVSRYEDHENINHYYKLFILAFILTNLVVFFIDYLIIDKQILRRLFNLTSFMEFVAITKDTRLKLEMGGKDEIYNLAQSTNRMLLALDDAYKDIKKMDERFRTIMEATNDGYLDFYVETKEVYISSEWKNLIGYKGEDGKELFKDYISRIHPDCISKIEKCFCMVYSGKSDYFIEEYKVVKDCGDIIWVLQRGKVSERDNNGFPIRIISTLEDITERKKYEDKILFLSYSDKLTGLRNRAFMEMELEKLDRQKNSVYSIIMVDINGLKMINDSLGHKAGDELLRTISNILKEACESNDIISRWGGGEFVILSQNKDRDFIVNLVENIKQACGNIEGFQTKISVAIGYAESDEENLDTESVMNLAEKRMYRNKLMDKRSCRGAVISSLLKTLHEKHTETEHHTMRIRYLSSKLGKRISLSKDKLDELELLSLLHDIGKIGIPEQILMKPSKLNDDEWRVMKTHCDIGYRIAKSTSELSHIAREILCHHERYDGNGYPNGLRGEDIPLLSRIISIVDSYDVMTHKRVYKEASSVDYAIEELKRCSGGQFDPYLTEKFIELLKEKK